MTNEKYGKTEGTREIDTLKLVASCWLFSVPVTRYPDYKLSREINDNLDKFVSNLGCVLRECGSGTGTMRQPIIAFRVRIEKDIEENVKKIKDYLTEKVMPNV